jgi:hypothetical protein
MIVIPALTMEELELLISAVRHARSLPAAQWAVAQTELDKVAEKLYGALPEGHCMKRD